MKVFQRAVPGYSHECIASFLHRTTFPSSFFSQHAPVRGACFAAGAESPQLAREFAETHLAFGTIVVRTDTMTTDEWRGIAKIFTRPGANFMNTAILLIDLDTATSDLQVEIATVVDAVDGATWIATATDSRRLSAELTLPFLVYLGLSSEGNMRFLAQDSQKLAIDTGSLRRAPPVEN